MSDPKKLSLDQLDDETRAYIQGLRKVKRDAELRLKEAQTELEGYKRVQAERDAAGKSALEAKQKQEASLGNPQPNKEPQVVDVRKLSKDDYAKAKRELAESFQRQAWERREQRFSEAIPKKSAENGKEPEPLDVRGMSKAEYAKVREAFRRSLRT